MNHTTWSPSKFGCYLECPAKAKYKYIDKLPDPGGPALERGSFIHEQCEMFVTGRKTELEEFYKGERMVWHPKTLDFMKALRASYGQGNVRTEMDLGFTREWKPCAWMAPDVWLRAKIDVVHLHPKSEKVEVIDWKTGKFKPNGEYDDQLSLYCVALLSALKTFKEATSMLWFTDVGCAVSRYSGTLTLGDLPEAQAKWEERVEPMFKDTVHAPTPGPTCRWCPFSVQKSGPCKF